MVENNAIHERGYVYNFHYHLVWVTKYRCAVFTTPQLVAEMLEILTSAASDNDINVEQAEVMADHVHLLLSFKPRYAPANVVKILKGASARTWFVAHPETKKLLWDGHLWSPSYYMGTLGDMSKETVANYIQNQRTERGKAGRPSKKTN
ncbi:IS200/IS605 family transposase [Lacticaseibacillus sp. 53-4]|uniref:IS200/IS605 family transposase n=1 Tax=Lacticaseibacillus sp. 53-4 TaxID=2799575 RepID=UPI001943B91A|nr:IS200/IS605 family transposase [Lacticaseibacillus sp. 53-4]